MLNLLLLGLCILFIVLSTTKAGIHPFLTLLCAALLMGFSGGLAADTLLSTLTEGFGNTLKSVGIVIACGTIIGTFLERTGDARSLATAIIERVGQKRSPLAVSITGFIVSIPVFCDSGFVILSAINKALSRKTGISLSILAVALASGLYTTHVFVPPTPGPLAAAGALGADVGIVLMLGLIVAVPTAAAGLSWALFYASKYSIIPEENSEDTGELEQQEGRVWLAVFPLMLPLFLIALKSVAEYPTEPLGAGVLRSTLSFLGNPVVALLLGVLLVMGMRRRALGSNSLKWVSDGLRDSGSIVLITGAGGAFGNVLRKTNIGDSLVETLGQPHLGLLMPFLIAALLKTAQGSSTVAIITTAALSAPLLEPMGLTTPLAKALVVLAIGAGAMTVSHFNDSYFWIVSQFSDLDTKTALRCHTLATLVQGITGIVTVLVLAYFLI